MSERDKERASPSSREPQQRPGKARGKRQRNRDRRTAELARAALALFIERGIDSVTVDDILDAAGVARGTFYRYFDNKAHVIEVLFTPLIERIRSGIRIGEAALGGAEPGGVAQAYLALAQEMVPIINESRDQALLYLQECHAPALGDRRPIGELAREIDEGARRLTEIAVEKKLIRTLDPRISALAVVGAVERVFLGLLRGEDVGEGWRIAIAIVDMAMRGLANRTG